MADIHSTLTIALLDSVLSYLLLCRGDAEDQTLGLKYTTTELNSQPPKLLTSVVTFNFHETEEAGAIIIPNFLMRKSRCRMVQ